MDLLEESKQGNKQAFVELITKYNHIFYKISKLFFTNDNDIEEILKKTFSQIFIEIINIRSEQEFLTSSIYTLILYCNEKENVENTKKSKKSFVEQQLLKIIEYLRLPTLLYYYVDLSTHEISKILKLSELETSNFITESRQKLSRELEKQDLIFDLKHYSQNELDKVIKKIFQSDISFNKTIFNNVNSYIENTNLIQNNYKKQHINILFIIILFLILISIYCFIENIIQSQNSSSLINFDNTLKINNTNSKSQLVFKPNFKNEVNENIINTNTIVTNTNTSNNRNTITNTTINSITNSYSNTQNITIKNSTSSLNDSTSTPIKLNTSSKNNQAEKTTFDEFELETFMKNYAVGIERISYDRETLESNTILLYIAEQYLASKSKKSSLNIDTTYATTAENIHKYLTDITTTDYTKINKISAYNNYIRYSESSKSYLYGNDHSILLKESYDCSNISILEQQDGIYTATATVTRTLDSQKTNYEITFTFTLNTNYTYEKFKILSLTATNTSFSTDNTVHFVDIQSEEDEK